MSAPSLIALQNESGSVVFSVDQSGNITGTTLSGTAATATLAATATVSNSIASASKFKSTEQTGTGSPQTVAHGLGSTPVLYFAVPTALSGGVFAVTAESADATNVTLTVTTGEKFKVVAFK